MITNIAIVIGISKQSLIAHQASLLIILHVLQSILLV